MFKHEVGMENEWEEMGEVERRQEPGVTWHIQEMEKEDPISDMTADDVRAVFGDNGRGQCWLESSPFHWVHTWDPHSAR